ncbi:MAG TPA: hypothetical protein VJ743_20055 [Albitalea sp.]|nr:hypothetical protein [Albitalea sp.]
MKFDRLARWGTATALAWLAGCDPHPKPAPPKAQAADDGVPMATATVFRATPVESIELVPEVAPPAAVELAPRHRGRLFGAGIRPSTGASGIHP